jgi:uncharacterized protein YjgD (DUF1641 family)
MKGKKMKDYTRNYNNKDANKVLDWIFETPIKLGNDKTYITEIDYHQEKVRNLTLKEARDEALKRFKELNKKEIYEDEVIGFWIADENENYANGWFSVGFKYSSLARPSARFGQNKSWIIDINR